MNEFSIGLYTESIDNKLIYQINSVYPHVELLIGTPVIYESKYNLIKSDNEINALKQAANQCTSQLLFWLNSECEIINGFDEHLINWCLEHDICYRPKIGYNYDTKFLSFNLFRKGKELINLLDDLSSIKEIIHSNSFESGILNIDLYGPFDIKDYIN